MSGNLKIDYAHLGQLFTAMGQVGDEAGQLGGYFRGKVCDPSGFAYQTCALRPIADVLPKMADWFDEAVRGFGTAWNDVGGGIYDAAKHIRDQDDVVREALMSYRANDIRCDATPPSIENFHLSDVEAALGSPADGGSSMEHDARFDAAAAAWDKARDTINDGIGLLNGLGAGITPLTELGLRDYLVYPLAADYTAIGRNANACKDIDKGFDAWARNLRQLAAKTPQSLEGETGAAVAATFLAFGRAMDLAGDALAKGALAFEGIARVSEKIAVEVEKVLVLLGTKITELATKVGSRLIPFAGELQMAFHALEDLFSGGSPLDQFKDIIDDIETVRGIIEDCLDLKKTIRAWAQAQAGRLESFHDVLDTLSGLPGVKGLSGLSDLNTKLGQAEHTFDDVDYGVDDTGQRGALDHELGGLQQRADGEGGSDDDQDAATDGDLSNGEYGDIPTQPPVPAGGGSYA
jgi:hypothetical protein